MPGFSEARLDPEISRGARVTIGRQTQVIDLQSGSEERVGLWAHSRRSYDIGYAASEPDLMAVVVAFFEARQGRLYGFRFKDWTDYKSSIPSAAVSPADQLLGYGDGVATTAQLVKRYDSGFEVYSRPIYKPREGVKIRVAGVEPADWSIDYTTGLITFTTPPADGAAITGGFEFDVPVRFAHDQLDLEQLLAGVEHIPSIRLVEDPRWQSEPGQEALIALNLANPLAKLVNVDLPAILGPLA